MAEQRTYSAFDVATLARELRDAAGASEEAFTRDQVVSMLGDEVRMLRERGMSDEKVAGLFTGFDVPVEGTELNDLINKSAWE